MSRLQFRCVAVRRVARRCVAVRRVARRCVAVLIAAVVFAASCGSSAETLQPGQRPVATSAAANPTALANPTEPSGASESDQGWSDIAGTDSASNTNTDTDTDTEEAEQEEEGLEEEAGSPEEGSEAPAPEAEPEAVVVDPSYFITLPPGSPLPSDQACAQAVRAMPFPETHPENAQANQTAGGPFVRIDGADEQYNDVLAPRISGDFTGTTEELIRWVACKWGFDEDLTRARTWTESSWSILTFGDETGDQEECDIIELAAPCFQSYGLLQVKGTVHDDTYPYAHASTAWGLDYAMAWQRACYEGAFSWLVDQGYAAGDVNGCVGAWFSGEWFDDLAVTYLADVAVNLNSRPWD